jgi:methylthioribose-1-phosphate isomerase
MNVDGVPYRSIWRQGRSFAIIDQSRLPFEFHVIDITHMESGARAIRDMQVRGAPLIGATAACSVALAMQEDPSDRALGHAVEHLAVTRPTAVNLRWALERMRGVLQSVSATDRADIAWQEAERICDEDVQLNQAIGRHGLTALRALCNQDRAGPLNVLTHCNAGWLATVDGGTALAPVYLAHDQGMALHVWVDETRPRNQGLLTAWELARHGVPHTFIADNAGGHLMRQGTVDVVIVGADRVTRNGDVCNKIGTYLKALAAYDNGVPFYAAVPGPTVDWTLECGDDIPIEERDAAEVIHVRGLDDAGAPAQLRILPEGSAASNPAFDVTPARLVSGLITERGIAQASRDGLLGLYPERRA